MVYYIKDTFENIYTAFDLQFLLKREDRPDNSQIDKDIYNRTSIFRTPNATEIIKASLPEPSEDDEDPIRNRYLQGDFDGGNLALIYGKYLPNFESNDPEDSFEVARVNHQALRSAYVDNEGNPSALSVFYRKDKPQEWIIVVAKNTHKNHRERMVSIMSSINPNQFIKDTQCIQVEEQSLTDARKNLQDISGLPAIEIIIQNLVDEHQGIIQKGAHLFERFFTGRLLKNELFDGHPDWMNLIKQNAQLIMVNPLLIALSSIEKDLSLNQIKQCLIEDSSLSRTLYSILNTPSKHQSQSIELALNLDQLNCLDQFSELNKSDKNFINLFNTLAKEAKNHAFLTMLLKEQNLNLLREINQDQKIEQSRVLAEDVIQYLNMKPNTDIKSEEFNELIQFLKILPGIEQINTESLVQFLSGHLENKELLKTVQETLQKLASLEVTNPIAYEQALRNDSFRQKIIALSVEEKSKKFSKECVNLAITLVKMEQLNAYDQLVTNQQWVNSFNLFMNSKEFKELLQQTLSTQDRERDYKKILENPLLITLHKERVTINKEQIDALLDPDSKLSKILNNLLDSQQYDEKKKRALYHLALDLARLDVLDTLDEFQNEETKSLENIQRIIELFDGSEELLKTMLTGYAPGIELITFMAHCDVDKEIMKRYVMNHSSDTLDSAISWLSRQDFDQKWTPTLLNLLIENPEIQKPELQFCMEFVKTLPKNNSSNGMVQEFLEKNYQNKEACAAVQQVFNRLAQAGIKSSEMYHLALTNLNFRTFIALDSSTVEDILAFAKFIRPAEMNAIIQYKLSEQSFNESITELLRNQTLNRILDAGIDPSEPQILKLLDPNSEPSKAINTLISLPLDNKIAYQYALIETPSALNFRKVLSSINEDSTIAQELKPEIIAMLSLLQSERPKDYDYFSLYLKNDDLNSAKFKAAILKIEQECLQIRTRLNVEAPQKAKAFIQEEQEYRKGLYQVVYETLNSKVTKSQFEAKITKIATPMLHVVDHDRHPWLRKTLMVLANFLNFLLFTIPSHTINGSPLFFAHTTSGQKVRDLHKALQDDFNETALKEEPKGPTL